MCMNHLFREEAFHFQFDEQVAFETGKDSKAMTVVKEIIQDGDRLECVVCAGLVTSLRFVELSLNCEPFFFLGPTKAFLRSVRVRAMGR